MNLDWGSKSYVKIKFWTLLGWFWTISGKMKLGLELRLLESEIGSRMLESIERYIDFSKLGLLYQWKKMLLNYASIMKLWFSRLKVQGRI